MVFQVKYVLLFNTNLGREYLQGSECNSVLRFHTPVVINYMNCTCATEKAARDQNTGYEEEDKTHIISLKCKYHIQKETSCVFIVSSELTSLFVKHETIFRIALKIAWNYTYRFKWMGINQYTYIMWGLLPVLLLHLDTGLERGFINLASCTTAIRRQFRSLSFRI